MNKVFVLLVFVLLIFTSCKRILLSIITKKSIDSQVRILENTETEKILYFLPMVHLGKPEYYESVKKIIDSLHQEGYIAYYEGLKDNDKIDSLTRDTLNRKIRKLLGFHLGTSYKDPDNKSLPRVFRNNNYVMQDYKKMGILKTDRHLDLSKDSLIRRYEHEVKPIQLLPCDFKTDLLEKYKCKDKEKYSAYKFKSTFREDHIVSEVLKSADKKIILVYGKGHWFTFWAKFRDNGFQLIYGKI